MDAYESGRAAWPALALSREAFTAFLASKEGPDEERAADLYLACACARGDGKALEAFEATYFNEVPAALSRVKNGEGLVDEVKQLLRERLFLGQQGRAPRIADYSGRGDLRNWMRVAVSRTVINLVTRGNREVPVEESVLLDLPTPSEDPELEHLKRVYRADFEAAFPEALGALTQRDRTLLRQRFLDGLTVDQLSALHAVHPATMARWLAKARSQLFSTLRKQLMAKLRVGQGELDSIVRMVRSQLDITLRRYLKD